MKVRYFADTDTLLIEFRSDSVAETRDLDERPGQTLRISRTRKSPPNNRLERRASASLEAFWTRTAHWFIVSAMSTSVVSASADVMSGTPVFPGTRVPVQTLLEYLKAGDAIDDFLAGFPSVSRSQVVAFLERATSLAVADAA